MQGRHTACHRHLLPPTAQPQLCLLQILSSSSSSPPPCHLSLSASLSLFKHTFLQNHPTLTIVVFFLNSSQPPICFPFPITIFYMKTSPLNAGTAMQSCREAPFLGSGHPNLAGKKTRFPFICPQKSFFPALVTPIAANFRHRNTGIWGAQH